MYYLYIVIVLALVATALWAIVCFHYVLQQQRRLNALWVSIAQLLQERDELYGDLQNLWVAPNAPKPDEHIHKLQELLAQEASLHWQEVQKRAAVRVAMDAEVQHIITHAQTIPALEGDALDNLCLSIDDNSTRLKNSVTAYNRATQIYNNLLQANPNRFLAQKFGLGEAPVYK